MISLVEQTTKPKLSILGRFKNFSNGIDHRYRPSKGAYQLSIRAMLAMTKEQKKVKMNMKFEMKNYFR